jgi:hypothetical protein
MNNDTTLHFSFPAVCNKKSAQPSTLADVVPLPVYGYCSGRPQADDRAIDIH